MERKRKRKIFYELSILLCSIMLPVAGSILSIIFLSQWFWQNSLIHTAVEALGGFIAWMIAVIILAMHRRNQIEPVHIWTSCALLGMGTLDILHSCVSPGITFVWLHSTATLVGGLFFALTWLPQRIAKSQHITSLPVITLFAASVFGALSILFPQILPLMVSQGKFTLTARLLNISGGILFFSAAIHFYTKFKKIGNREDLIFTNHCLLFGMAGSLFEVSILWDAGWWWWHILRLTAYLLALCYLFVIYRKLEETIRITNEKLNTEIIERRQKESSLEQYGLLFDNISDLAYICDIEGNILFVNKAFEKLSGHKPEKFIGKSFAPLFDEENLKKAMDLYTRTLKGESLKREVCFKDTGVLCEYNNKPLRDTKGNIIGVLGTARDITERKHLENERKNIKKSLEQRVARRTKEWAKANEALQIKIVQHRKAEGLLHESKEQLQSILDNSTAVIYLKDRDGKYLLINKEFERLFKIGRHDIVDKTDQDIFPEETAGILQANDRKVIKAGIPLELEETIHHDDRPRTYISLKFPLFDSSCIPDRICGISTDITERKQSEDVLRKSEAKYSRLIENLQDNYFFYSHNAEGIFTYLSPAITNILGYDTEEFLTHYSEYMTDNPGNEKVIKHTELSIKGIKQPPYELEIYHKGGSIRTLLIQEVPVFDMDHKVIAVEGIAEDITKRKKTEEDLKKSEAAFRSLIDDVLDNSTVGIFILDANFQIIWVNKALEQYFGLKRKEIIGRDKRQTIRDKIIYIFEDQEHFAEKVLATYDDNTYTESFECHVMPEGQRKERWLLHSSMPIKSGLYAGGRIEHYHDITNSKQAEKASLSYQTQLKRLSSTLSLTEERERRHISEDLHDRIGQAMTVIKMKLEELSEPQVDTDSRRILDETRELLDNAIQDTRTLTFEISPPLLYELGFEPAVEWLIEQFRERHNIPIDYEGNGDGSMLDDDVSFFLFKSVRELLFNIVKHAGANKIKVSVQRDTDRIKISIEDNGVGFDSSKVQFSVDNLSGFGLFSIRERMEHFGGKFDIKSKPDKGTCITLALKQQGGDRGAK